MGEGLLKQNGKIECPKCQHVTCHVFPDGGEKCFHPQCDYQKSAYAKSGKRMLPRRKKPRKTKKALLLFNELPQPKPNHRYLRKKKHRGDITLSVLGNVRQDGENLAVPLYDDTGKLKNIQYISPEGRKWNLEGCSTRGLFYRIGDAGTSKVGLVEGWATGISFYRATGLDTLVAFGCNNLGPIATYLTAIGKDVIVVADVGEASEMHAEEVAAQCGGQIFVPEFPKGISGNDVNDLAAKRGLEEVKRQVEERTVVAVQNTDYVQQLADLTPEKYSKIREEVARLWNMKVEQLDKDVGAKRQQVTFRVVIPSPNPVGGDALFAEIEAGIASYVRMSESSVTAIALWIMMTYVMDEIWCAPILALLSPEKRCGKTTTLSVLQRLVHKPMLASNISTAAVFRAIQAYGPSLLTDEADTYLPKNDELRGILNSGHTRDAAFVIRCTGDDHEPLTYSTWAAKVIAAIGTIPDTLQDRSIIVPMRRKLPSEQVRRIKREKDGDIWDRIRPKIVRWISDNKYGIDSEKVKRVKGLHDRANDNWRPLLQIAKRLGGDVLERARDAAITLAADDVTDVDSNAVILLRDLKKLFDDDGGSKLTTTWILSQLSQLEDHPWPELSRGDPITSNQLAKMLKPFGIVPRPFKAGKGPKKKAARGYRLRDCEDVFARYSDVST